MASLFGCFHGSHLYQREVIVIKIRISSTSASESLSLPIVRHGPSTAGGRGRTHLASPGPGDRLAPVGLRRRCGGRGRAVRVGGRGLRRGWGRRAVGRPTPDPWQPGPAGRAILRCGPSAWVGTIRRLPSAGEPVRAAPAAENGLPATLALWYAPPRGLRPGPSSFPPPRRAQWWRPSRVPLPVAVPEGGRRDRSGRAVGASAAWHLPFAAPRGCCRAGACAAPESLSLRWCNSRARPSHASADPGPQLHGRLGAAPTGQAGGRWRPRTAPCAAQHREEAGQGR